MSGIVTGYALSGTLHDWIWEVTVIEIESPLESALLSYTNCMPCKNAISSRLG